MTTEATERLAVLIDAENVPAKHVAAIFEEVATLGEASLRRAYGDFSKGGPQGWNAKELAKHAIVPHQQFANTSKKNAGDIALVIDAMDILHSGRFGGFVLVSSDSDFTRLASRIREQGLSVFGIGEEKAPKAFVQACNRFIYIENLKSMSETTEGVQETSDQEPERTPNHAYQLIRNVVLTTKISDGWATEPFIERQLEKIYPDFDSRSYGYSSLRDLVLGIDRFEVDDSNSNFRIRCKDK